MQQTEHGKGGNVDLRSNFTDGKDDKSLTEPVEVVVVVVAAVWELQLWQRSEKLPLLRKC